MNRGDVWMIDLGGQIGTRPVLILTRQRVINYLNKVIIAEITTRGKGYPTEIFIDQKGNLPKPSFVQADNLHTVPKTAQKVCWHPGFVYDDGGIAESCIGFGA